MNIYSQASTATTTGTKFSVDLSAQSQVSITAKTLPQPWRIWWSFPNDGWNGSALRLVEIGSMFLDLSLSASSSWQPFVR